MDSHPPHSTGPGTHHLNRPPTASSASPPGIEPPLQRDTLLPPPPASSSGQIRFQELRPQASRWFGIQEPPQQGGGPSPAASAPRPLELLPSPYSRNASASISFRIQESPLRGGGPSPAASTSRLERGPSPAASTFRLEQPLQRESIQVPSPAATTFRLEQPLQRENFQGPSPAATTFQLEQPLQRENFQGPSPAATTFRLEQPLQPENIQGPSPAASAPPVTHHPIFPPIFPPQRSMNLSSPPPTNTRLPLRHVLYPRSQLLVPRRSEPGTTYHPYLPGGQPARPPPRHPAPQPPQQPAPRRSSRQAPPPPPPSGGGEARDHPPQLYYVKIDDGCDFVEIMNAFLHRVAWNAQSAALILNGNGAIQDPSLKSIGRTVSHHHQGLYQITSCEGCVCFPEDGRGGGYM
ncbi:hypothetical protein DM860_017751 [Cuscuta australis]|uniref:Uncharacterized protein n=1 Tax=Cuscuta australis TaxID=267555 RepID=A0A328D5Q6_9ASTE|nr:hypothetical protein DM860_017751 [Cuscuta australis]